MKMTPTISSRIAMLATSLAVTATLSTSAMAADAAVLNPPPTPDSEYDAYLRSIMPNQAHTMADVAYHFTNLWFAGKARNWPLAQFYFNEARNHILWTIRLSPVRKISTGDLRLEDMFKAVDIPLTTLKERIAAGDAAGFKKAYSDAVNGCNACHTAVEKPFFRIRIPTQPEVQVMDFRPAKTK
ncbi:MAG: hypothetical protein LBE59_05905 [Nevskiaceae bacterium]|nr:hypothetical protein [Nevskiaceae bacterium]